MRRFVVRLEPELHEKLRKESFETRLSMNEIMRKALKDYFKMKGEKTNE